MRASRISSQSAPARMRRSHHRTIQGGKQHRQAVGNHDGAGDTALCGETRIGLTTVRRGGVQLQDIRAMNLLQEDRMRAQSLLKQGAVGMDAGEVITHMVTQVQAVPGSG